MPLDNCVTVMDFSENITLQSQDEIESAHWTQKQVTFHPIFIIRHATESTTEKPVILKESLSCVSDHLTHDAKAVYIYTEQLFIHLEKNPGPVAINVLHRFSDNAACQYKCKEAFDHLCQLEDRYGVQIIYHYTETGHAKGQSDGIGAGIKKKLDGLILRGFTINNAYQVYLSLRQNPSSNCHQHVIYVPSKKIAKSAPQKSSKIKTLKGTQTFHMVRQWKPHTGILVCSDLGCFCSVYVGRARCMLLRQV